MRKYATTLLMAATMPIGEIHTFWEKSASQPVNWIISKYVPMPVQWNIKFVSDQLNMMLIMLAFFLYKGYSNKVNDTTVLTFLIFSVVDTLMYFYNYKTYGYGITYFGIASLWFLVYFCLKRTKYTWNKPS